MSRVAWASSVTRTIARMGPDIGCIAIARTRSTCPGQRFDLVPTTWSKVPARTTKTRGAARGSPPRISMKISSIVAAASRAGFTIAAIGPELRRRRSEPAIGSSRITPPSCGSASARRGYCGFVAEGPARQGLPQSRSEEARPLGYRHRSHVQHEAERRRIPGPARPTTPTMDRSTTARSL